MRAKYIAASVSNQFKKSMNKTNNNYWSLIIQFSLLRNLRHSCSDRICYLVMSSSTVAIINKTVIYITFLIVHIMTLITITVTNLL